MAQVAAIADQGIDSVVQERRVFPPQQELSAQAHVRSLGATHCVIVGGFAAKALVDRITDAEAVAVITQDGSYRRGSEVRLKPAVDEALEQCPTVKSVVVYQRTHTRIHMQPGRDHWWHE